MNRSAKILTILLCVLVCAGGALFSLKEKTKGVKPKTQVAPIDNHEPQRSIWTWA